MNLNRFYLGPSGSERLLAAGDCELQVPVSQVGGQRRNLAGDLITDLVASKRSFRLQYDWLPAETRCVPDGGLGRDALYALYAAGGPLSFHVPTAASGCEDVTVQFALGSWSEKLLQAGGAYGTVYAVSFTLEEG